VLNPISFSLARLKFPFSSKASSGPRPEIGETALLLSFHDQFEQAGVGGLPYAMPYNNFSRVVA
jgi:hypothetical protein